MLWVAGEFTTTNGRAQQGLTRFGPGPGTVAPSAPSNVSAESLKTGENQIRWRASLDNDDSELTYSVYRNGSTTAAGHRQRQLAVVVDGPGVLHGQDGRTRNAVQLPRPGD